MISKQSHLYSCALFAFIACLAMGCGKKAEEASSAPDRYQPPQLTDIELELSKQELFCPNEIDCPNYITKLAILEKNKLKFCTGFLTKNNVVVTASSCFPERLRTKNALCDKDITIFFPNPLPEKPTRVGCEKILDVTPVDTAEAPYLWRSNVAYLKLNLEDPIIRKDVDARTNKTIIRAGMADMDKFYTWSVDQIDGSQGIIRKSEDCQAVHGSYFNPQSTNSSSPLMTLSGCKFAGSNTGAPVLDYRNKIRGIVSSDVGESEMNEARNLKINELPLKSQMHVTNFACAPIYKNDETIQNESECQKDLSPESHKLGKENLLNESLLFRSAVQKVEAELNKKNDYFKLVVKLDPGVDGYDFRVEVPCFKNVSSWIHSFKGTKISDSYLDVPVKKIKKSMSEFGKVYAVETGETKVLTKFQFKPSLLLRTDPKATVFMWAVRPEVGPTTPFYDVPASCPVSLL